MHVNCTVYLSIGICLGSVHERTVNFTGAHFPTVSAAKGSNDGKRVCTFLLCISASGAMLPLAIIFDGKGNISEEERNAYAKDVNVFFYDNAWACTDFFLDWIKVVKYLLFHLLMNLKYIVFL